MISDSYELYYWPTIPGRGELVRLVLEDAGIPYVDVGRVEGVQAVVAQRRTGSPPPFAPPILVRGPHRIAQVAAILDHLASTHGLIAPDARTRALQHQLTVQDVLLEAHDTHHPIAIGQYYEDQRDAAIARATYFRTERLPMWLAYLEGVVADAGGGLVGPEVHYPDLSLFQVVAGLRYAFPDAMASLDGRFPGIEALCEAIAARPRVAAYLASDRRLPFNEHGIFRRYPELDGPVPAG